MPNNSLGSDPDPTIDIPRQPIANDPGFDVLRTLDGRMAGSERDQENVGGMDACEIANPHQVHGGAKYGGS